MYETDTHIIKKLLKLWYKQYFQYFNKHYYFVLQSIRVRFINANKMNSGLD